MRTAFINELINQARLHPEIFLIVGDLGFSVVEPFADEFPDRFLNAGVAEQNMTGVAAGLASEGYHVFTYSIANFPTLRCLEQIRNDVCYHNLPVTVVAVGGGLAYGNLGYSHHAVQDVAILRSLGNMRVMAPSDPGETVCCLRELVNNPCPSYLRLGKAGEQVLHATTWSSGIIPVRIGEAGGTAIICAGAILKEAIKAADMLLTQGLSVSVFSCPQIHPLENSVLGCLNSFKSVLVVEEHVKMGGLYSALRENLSSHIGIHSQCLKNTQNGSVGTQEYLCAQAGIDAPTIAQRLSSLI
jgi:transketolase